MIRRDGDGLKRNSGTNLDRTHVAQRFFRRSPAVSRVVDDRTARGVGNFHRGWEIVNARFDRKFRLGNRNATSWRGIILRGLHYLLHRLLVGLLGVLDSLLGRLHGLLSGHLRLL